MGIALTAEWYIPLLRKMSVGTFRLVGNQYSAEFYDHRSLERSRADRSTTEILQFTGCRRWTVETPKG
jgi:hypothetical protein